MSTIIYTEGAAILKNLTIKQKEAILSIKQWKKPIFTITDDFVLEFTSNKHESLSPFMDLVEKPLRQVLKITGKNIKGVFTVTCCDDKDYDNIAIFIENGKMFFRNSEIINASTKDLKSELKRRRRNKIISLIYRGRKSADELFGFK